MARIATRLSWVRVPRSAPFAQCDRHCASWPRSSEEEHVSTKDKVTGSNPVAASCGGLAVYGAVGESGVPASLSKKRSPVQIWSAPPLPGRLTSRQGLLKPTMEVQFLSRQPEPPWANWRGRHPLTVKSAGSNPAGGTRFGRVAQVVSALLLKSSNRKVCRFDSCPFRLGRKRQRHRTLISVQRC